MKLCPLAAAVVAALFAMPASAEPVPGEEVIYHLDFDEHMGPEFSVDPYDNGATLTRENPHSGVYALEGRGGGGPFQYFGVADPLPLLEGRSYRLNVWARTQGTLLSFIHVFYHQAGKMTTPPQSARLQIPQSNEWRESELIFTVPPEFEGGELRFRLASAPPEARVWFDDLTISLLPPGLKTDYRCSSARQIVTVRANVADYMAQVPLEEMTLDVAFVSSGTGETLARTSFGAIAEMLFEVECPIADLPAGKYSVRAMLRNGEGTEVDASEMPFEVFRDPEWIGNDLGKLKPSDAPPPPWTPLEADGPVARVWGREIALTESGLPKSIRVAGEEILAEPVRLQIGDAEMGDARISAPVGGGLSAQWESVAQVDGLEVTARTEIEFDGMLKYTLRLEPRDDGPAQLDGLRLEVPLRAEVGRLLQAIPFDGAWAGREAVDLASEPEWSAAEFMPHLWVGEEERGIAWFAESMDGWNAGETPPLRIVRSGEQTRLVITMIDAPTTLAEPLEIVFGLQPTPTRPPHPVWKDIRFRTKSPPPNVSVIWAHDAYDRYYGFPRVVEDTAKFEQMLDSGAEYILRLIYQRNADEHLPEFRYYEDRWRGEGAVYPLQSKSFGPHLLPVNYTDELWQDFIVYSIHDWAKRWGIRGMYHDCFGPLTKDGRVEVFAFRELAKRVYTMHRRLDPKALTIVFGSPWVPCVSFADAVLTGEMYRGPLAEHQWYPAFMSLAQFRAANVVDLGPSRMILPQYKIAYGDSVPHAVHAMGIFLLHDLPLYAAWLNMDVYEAVETRRLTFGRAGFHGYWEDGGRVATGNQGLAASYYERASGLLLTVANVTGEDISSTVALDLTGLDLPPDVNATVYDPLTGTEETVALKPNEALPADVKAWMMLLIQLGGPQ